MDEIKDSPLLAAASCFAFLLAFALLVQATGNLSGFPLPRYSLAVSAPFALALTYGYFFRLNARSMLVLFFFSLLLWLLGMASLQLYDMSSDGLGYQQPSAEAVYNGWNPLKPNYLLWQNIYPSGIWGLEAAISALYGTIEAAKSLQIWLIFIAYPVLLAGMRQHKPVLRLADHLLIALIVLCPVVLTQMLTHYVDAMLYLCSVIFLGALLLYKETDKRLQHLSLLLMCASVLLIVNSKLSGIYHAAVLCFAALVFIGMDDKRIPVKPAIALFSAGLVATFFLGFHPYVTNFLTYGSLLHMDADSFSAFQRPANLSAMLPPQRFFASLFAMTGGAPRIDAVFKWPWMIQRSEWVSAGTSDPRTGGFGVWFALAFCSAVILLHFLIRKPRDTRLLVLAALLFISSFVFPEGWWARYVPFAYTGVLFTLLALPSDAIIAARAVRWCVLLILFINSTIAGTAGFNYAYDAHRDFVKMATFLRTRPENTVYLVPPGSDYMIYNQAHLPLQRRLLLQGVHSTVRVGAPCPSLAETISEFKICY